MPKYLVKAKCYYAEKSNKGKRPQLMYPGEVYESKTLEPKDAPRFFELIKTGGEVAPAPAPKGNEGSTVLTGGNAGGIGGESEVLGMTYNEMKTFVADNEISVPDLKKATLEDAILKFQKGGSETGGEGGTTAEVPND